MSSTLSVSACGIDGRMGGDLLICKSRFSTRKASNASAASNACYLTRVRASDTLSQEGDSFEILELRQHQYTDSPQRATLQRRSKLAIHHSRLGAVLQSELHPLQIHFSDRTFQGALKGNFDSRLRKADPAFSAMPIKSDNPSHR